MKASGARFRPHHKCRSGGERCKRIADQPVPEVHWQNGQRDSKVLVADVGAIERGSLTYLPLIER